MWQIRTPEHSCVHTIYAVYTQQLAQMVSGRLLGSAGNLLATAPNRAATFIQTRATLYAANWCSYLSPLHLHTDTHTNTQTHTHTHTHARTHARTHTYTHTYIYIYINTCANIRTRDGEIIEWVGSCRYLGQFFISGPKPNFTEHLTPLWGQLAVVPLTRLQFL